MPVYSTDNLPSNRRTNRTAAPRRPRRSPSRRTPLRAVRRRQKEKPTCRSPARWSSPPPTLQQQARRFAGKRVETATTRA
uniref:Uncharacterized protein n=1 Tax=Arundo donax TaxID=35708 RepID=A0A0A9AFK8_ARUDO